jgi:hypothetical protein
MSHLFFSRLAAALLAAIPALCQQTSVFATGLQHPYKLAITPAGTLVVSEAGEATGGGRISLVNSAGTRQTLLAGLPSGESNPDLDLIGPTGIGYRNRILYIAISEGDAIRNGTAPGSIVLNPAGVSSPLFASVLRVRFDADLEGLQSPFTLTRAQHQTLADGYEVTLTNTEGRTAVVDVLADFPPVTPDANTVYRHQDPFGLVLDPSRNDTLYLVEAGQNALYRIHTETGRTQVVTRFAPTPNPTQIGPPVIDAVPTGAIVLDGQVLVTRLSGFPFIPGFGGVSAVNPATGASSPWITGLNSAIDIAYRTSAAGANQFFVLGFSSNLLADPAGPGQLWFYDSPAGRVVANQLVAPTGMVADPRSGDVFVAEMGPGRITRVRVP